MGFIPEMLAYCGIYCEQCPARTAFLDQDEKHLANFPARCKQDRPKLSDYACPRHT